MCGVYARLFARVIARVLPELDEAELVARYNRIRAPRAFQGDAAAVRKIFVLSRVTLGADVAITSVILDAAKRRFPAAQIFLAGPRKNWELFGGDARIEHLPVSYGRRDNLADRLGIWPSLRAALSQPNSIVIDPDSRLTQLGLLPVCAEENYFFFESRAYGGDAALALPVLARQWAAETFGITDAKAFLAPLEPLDPGPHPLITVSLGVGGNPAKRIADPFEENLLRGLIREGELVLVDQGAGGEETERVERAIARCGAGPDKIRAWQGSFASFASLIAHSRLYVGYDSAGQHAAAACGVPLVTIFAGFASQRLFERWSPSGPGPIQVVRAPGGRSPGTAPDPQIRPAQVLSETLAAVNRS